MRQELVRHEVRVVARADKVLGQRVGAVDDAGGDGEVRLLEQRLQASVVVVAQDALARQEVAEGGAHAQHLRLVVGDVAAVAAAGDGSRVNLLANILVVDLVRLARPLEGVELGEA